MCLIILSGSYILTANLHSHIHIGMFVYTFTTAESLCLQAVPWSYKKRHPTTKEILKDSKGNELWEGYCIDLLEKLSQLMEFDYEIVPPANGGFGTRHPDGTWDGIVGDLAMGVC